jgi:hypothetical protein
MHCAPEEFGKLTEDPCRLVGDDRLWLVPAVAAPEGKPNELVILSEGEVREAVEAVTYPLEVSTCDTRRSGSGPRRTPGGTGYLPRLREAARDLVRETDTR